MILTSTIIWRSIETAPLEERIFVADLIDRICKIGHAELDSKGDVIIVSPGIPTTSAKHWTHWAALPELPQAPKEDTGCQ